MVLSLFCTDVMYRRTLADSESGYTTPRTRNLTLGGLLLFMSVPVMFLLVLAAPGFVFGIAVGIVGFKLAGWLSRRRTVARGAGNQQGSKQPA